MRELPLLLDEPVADLPAISTPAAMSPAPLALSRPRPLWMAPAWLIGRYRPRLRAAAAADALALERYPRMIVEAVLLLLVLLLVAGASASHAMHHYQNAAAGVEWLRLRLADTYLELPIFLLLAILVGEALPSLGVVLVLVFGALDIVVAATQPQELTPLPTALAGRLVAIWALWLLVVEIPIFARWLADSMRGTAGSLRALAGSRFFVAPLAALTAGAFTWFWTQAAPILARPMFVWSNLGDGVAVAAVRPVQSAGAVFAVFAGVVAGAVAFSRRPQETVEEPHNESIAGASPVVATLRGLLVAALLTVTLAGIIGSPLEAAVMFAALAFSGPLARFVNNRTILGTVVRLTPPPLRYAAAAGLSIGVCWLVIGQLFVANIRATVFGNHSAEFFSVVFAMAIAFFAVALATTPSDEGVRRRTGLASTATTAMVLGAALLVLMVATPVTALADNCSSLTDCWDTVALAALAGGAMPFLLSMVPMGKPWGNQKPPKYDPWMGGLLVPPPPQQPDQYEYPGGDHMPIDGHALHSAGGTRA